MIAAHRLDFSLGDFQRRQRPRDEARAGAKGTVVCGVEVRFEYWLDEQGRPSAAIGPMVAAPYRDAADRAYFSLAERMWLRIEPCSLEVPTRGAAAWAASGNRAYLGAQPGSLAGWATHPEWKDAARMP